MNSQPAPCPGIGLPSLVALGQHRPDVAETAFIAPDAVLRADRDTIFVGDRCNVQDECVMHADPGVPLSVGSDVTIGHNTTLHGRTVDDLVLIGMGAIVLNGARVGRRTIPAPSTWQGVRCAVPRPGTRGHIQTRAAARYPPSRRP